MMLHLSQLAKKRPEPQHGRDRLPKTTWRLYLRVDILVQRTSNLGGVSMSWPKVHQLRTIVTEGGRSSVRQLPSLRSDRSLLGSFERSSTHIRTLPLKFSIQNESLLLKGRLFTLQVLLACYLNQIMF